MKGENELFESPLVTRNASEEMSRIFGAQYRIETWRRLWIALAEAQRELGLPISAGQIAQLKRGLKKIDFAQAAKYEARTRHDVMAHLHAFGDVAPQGSGDTPSGGDQRVCGG